MEWRRITFDWNQARAFLVTAEEGSLSAAARALGLTQPTLGRQVAALEAQLGVLLFNRAGRALKLTESGLELLEHVRIMGAAAAGIALTASGQSQAIEGEVRITATQMMAAYHLPGVLKALKAQAPGITVNIVASNQIRDLNRREADIAIRHVRPEQPDLIARQVAEVTAHLYAAREYLDVIGRPQCPEDLSTADFIGFESPERMLPVFESIGLTLKAENFKYTTESGTVILALVRQGLGFTILTKDVADQMPDIEQVLPGLPAIPVPVWLVTHRELHTSRRIRLVFDLLVEQLA